PLLVAGAAAALVATWRWRALVVGAIFVGWALGGSAYAWPVQETDHAIAALAQPGDTVAITPGVEPWIYAFLPKDVKPVPWSENATFVVQDLEGSDHHDVSNYTLVANYSRNPDFGPGALLRLKLETHLGDAPPKFAL